MNLEDKYKLKCLLKEYQDELVDKSQNSGYQSAYRLKYIDDSKVILNALIIIEDE